MIKENFIYSPEAAKFKCSVPLEGSRQVYVVDGVIQSTGDPFFFRAGKREVMEDTLQVISIRSNPKSPELHLENNFLFDEYSDSKLLLCSHTASQEVFITHERVLFNVKEGAVADVVIMQNEANPARHFTNFEINMDSGSQLKIIFLTLHGGEIRNNLKLSLNGEHISCDIEGLYLADMDQIVENRIRLEHNKPNCISNQTFKGLLDDSAKGYFHGTIYVAPDAQKSEAYQANHNLLVSGSARMYTEPQLEIYADDVKCSHGATVGSLDEMELFYLRSRGIPVKEAKILQQLAFTNEVLSKIANPQLRYRMESLVDKRLRGEFSRCQNCSKNCC